MQTSWATMPQAEITGQDDMKSAVDTAIQTSNGMEPSRERNDEIDIDEEAKGWGKDFGVDAAETMKHFVVGVMEYLRQYAIR